MLININCAKCSGIQAVPVTVEVDISNGIGIHLVGLADIAVKESLLRIMTALHSLGYKVPGKKIVINLAPADVRKNGSGYDLPIAVGILAASGQCDIPDIGKYLIMGELGLDGSLRPVPGAIPIAEYASLAGFEGCILPAASAYEAAELSSGSLYAARDLIDVLRILEEKEDISGLRVEKGFHPAAISAGPSDDYMDFSEIIGQKSAKRGLEIAAAGGHNVIMVGSPGCGKTSLAKAMVGIMPPLRKEEAIVTSKIYSVSGITALDGGLVKKRPFRAPHYSASLAAIIGGGNGDNIQPGEVSLAHNGILFLDEFAQMPKSVTEALRGPLEDRKVVISRLRSKIEYPASFTLVAAANPCPCGYYGVGDRCTCTPSQRQSYMSRLSGPIMDRIDIQLYMEMVSPEKLVNRVREESSADVAARVMAARNIQMERFAGTEVFVNAEMTNAMMERFCHLSPECREIMQRMSEAMGFSARAYGRILKISRTIADLEAVNCGFSQAGDITPEHLIEAAGFRFLDRFRGI
ncbi:MAG: YifB family Mg chelatase-like AAA ATPase [Candidatus Cryptobacteroides sp.]